MAITRCSCGKYDVEWNIAYIGMSIKKKQNAIHERKREWETRWFGGNA